MSPCVPLVPARLRPESTTRDMVEVELLVHLVPVPLYPRSSIRPGVRPALGEDTVVRGAFLCQ